MGSADGTVQHNSRSSRLLFVSVPFIILKLSYASDRNIKR